jgi:dolichyl-phosphate beta-glucosyltransferase
VHNLSDDPQIQLPSIRRVEQLRQLMANVSIVIPCYNESKRLRANEYIDFCSRNSTITFFFVNDGSTDSTEKVLREMNDANNQQIRIVSYSSNAGKGEAVRRGMIAAIQESSDFIGYWDADLSVPLENIELFANILSAKPSIDFVLATRLRLLGRRIERSQFRYISGRLFARIIRILFGIRIFDIQCGAKLFRSNNVLSSSLNKAFLTRWLFDIEFLMRIAEQIGINRLEDRIYEYPLDECLHIDGSKLNHWAYFTAMLDLVRVFINVKFFRSNISQKNESFETCL